VLEKTAPSPPASCLPTARSRTVAPEVEQPSPAGGRNVRALGVSMTSMHDWDAGSVLTLVLGLIATIALGAALVLAVRD
jgi:hypothetical protein